MKDKKKTTLWERYLTKEIGIEFKACLYFFAILFFYSMYRICIGSLEASIIHMAEMIFACYIIGYVQVYLLWNFDEADSVGAKEIAGVIICTAIYSLLSYFLRWFDKNIYVTLGLAAYVLVTYICVILIYKTKRNIDDKKLNEDLALFKTEHKKVQDRVE
ncbi:DUF3021 family protein [Butyrivibrio sp. MC2021]|uniref:DUF3021 family protein n=1 Tax=Butyrivibrio sp. MC2021 TaxID=1408306 RepID=UPI00047BDEC8|nr:DUF3021 family protein [Butyrivibrio sp. MC2021]